ncbi:MULTISPECIES: Ldh family oxidoreductase [unclassified Achromobacter]|uniref:Ldh family oxidoreductase n=1 Tax=unclassified Achromobacter TaxID=2626865 RepID=UPI000B51894A|nr:MULTISPECIES: Ldh family oxidoreductase [unclassified Achromobacter]OWT71496.1 lactate dehydrogenase [Achromobacter sp. HZ34]OWT73153.1 lactate dehydrogenase [Achromobacter sp. HZ28]
MSDHPRYDASALIAHARALLEKLHMPADKAAAVAEILVEADLMGSPTHGLNLLDQYLEHVQKGHMQVQGDPEVVSKRPAVEVWDGKRLPGPWLVLRALESAIARAATYGTGTVVIKNSHHIGSLATYLRRATARGVVLHLVSSAPSASSVAPYGGRKALFSPSPIAIGLPATTDPILVDISASITTNNMVKKLAREGKKLPGKFLLDADGNPSDDPAVIAGSQPGTLLPLGGLDAGHKGYGLALLVEGLTAGLSDQGRAQDNGPMANTIYLQVIDPEAFGGLQAFEQQMEQVAQACRDNPPRPGVESVRVPGQKGMATARQQAQQGIALAPGIVAALEKWSAHLDVPMPAPCAAG